MKEQTQFNNWLSTEKGKGLIDIKLYPVNVDTAEKEHIYTELNSMNFAIEESRFSQINDL